MPGDLGGGPPEGGGGVTGTGEAGQPKASDETQWRARALQAESKVQELQGAMEKLGGELKSARDLLESLQKRREVERQLIEAQASDVETTFLLVEDALKKEPGRDVGEIVRDLAGRKPFLFKKAGPSKAAALSAQPGEDRPGPLDEARTTAQKRGDRRSLLRYLRVKRGG